MLQFPVISNSALKFYSILIQLNSNYWLIQTIDEMYKLWKKIIFHNYILMYKDGRMS